MTLFRRLILSLALLAGIAPALAQVPAPVPALPDSERRTSYSISGTQCTCAVNMALFGDGTDFNNWLEVYLNGVNVAFNDPTFGWAITSPSPGGLTQARPITNAVLTFTNAQTGTVQIVGARRPRRTVQFAENAGVSARNLNQAFTDIIATQRETWDKTNDVTGRALLSQPGVTLALLPTPALCAGSFLGFDATGLNPVCVAGGPGSGNVVGPASSTIGDVALFNNATGTLLKDGGTIRTTLFAARPYFVRASAGASADTNCSGLVNVDDPGTGTLPRACAFLTPQKYINTVLYTLDLNGQNVTADATGAFTSGFSCAGTFVGGTGANVTFTSTAGASITTTSANSIAAGDGCNLNITGNLTLSTVTSGVELLTYNGGHIGFSGITFGPAGGTSGHIQAGAQALGTKGGGTITANGSYTVTGGGTLHWHAPIEGSFVNFNSGVAVTIANPVTFTGFWGGATKGLIYASGVSFVNPGNVTGPKYLVHKGGVAVVSTDQTDWPGTVAGTTESGGVYTNEASTIADYGVARLIGTNGSAPSTPAAGFNTAWFDSTDLRFHDKNSAGAIGTTVVADPGAANNFLTAISAAGGISKARPACASLSDASVFCNGTNAANLTGTLAAAQEPAHTGDMTNTAGSLATVVTKTNGVPFTAGATNSVAAEQARLGIGVLNFSLPAANFNSTADQSIAITLPTGFTRYRIQFITFSNPSISLTTAAGGLYTAASKGGIALVAAGQAYSGLTTNTAGASGSLLNVAATNFATAFYNSATLFLSLTTPQGATATADVSIGILPLP